MDSVLSRRREGVLYVAAQVQRVLDRVRLVVVVELERVERAGIPGEPLAVGQVARIEPPPPVLVVVSRRPDPEPPRALHARLLARRRAKPAPSASASAAGTSGAARSRGRR